MSRNRSNRTKLHGPVQLPSTDEAEAHVMAAKSRGVALSRSEIGRAAANRSTYFKQHPDEAFKAYMHGFRGGKIGLYLQRWIDGAGENKVRAKKQVQDWIDRNRAALK